MTGLWTDEADVAPSESLVSSRRGGTSEQLLFLSASDGEHEWVGEALDGGGGRD